MCGAVTAWCCRLCSLERCPPAMWASHFLRKWSWAWCKSLSASFPEYLWQCPGCCTLWSHPSILGTYVWARNCTGKTRGELVLIHFCWLLLSFWHGWRIWYNDKARKLSFMVDYRTATLQRAQYNFYYTVPFVLHSSRTWITCAKTLLPSNLCHIWWLCFLIALCSVRQVVTVVIILCCLLCSMYLGMGVFAHYTICWVLTHWASDCCHIPLLV